jgi:hypothetical protein
VLGRRRATVLTVVVAAALAEFGDPLRSRAVRDLAARGAQAPRDQQRRRGEAIQFLRRVSTGEDDRFDSRARSVAPRWQATLVAGLLLTWLSSRYSPAQRLATTIP